MKTSKELKEAKDAATMPVDGEEVQGEAEGPSLEDLFVSAQRRYPVEVVIADRF